MPVYNPEPTHFRQAVESILGQTFADLELVIIEDPSRTSAADLLAPFRDQRIRHFVNHPTVAVEDKQDNHQGPPSLAKYRSSWVKITPARNRALRESRGEFVACADSDDISEPDRLAKQVDYLTRHPEVAVVGSQLSIIDAAGAELGARQYPDTNQAILAAMTLYNAMAQPTVMFRRQLILDAGGYQAGFCAEDYELWSRLASRGALFANLPDPLVRYRIVPQGRRKDTVRPLLAGTLEVKRLYWLKGMSLRAKLRMCGERLLLLLPPQWVLALFVKAQFRRRSGSLPAVASRPGEVL